MVDPGKSLRERVQSVIDRGASALRDDREFEALTLEALAWQRSRCAALDRALDAAGEGRAVEGLGTVVGVPTDAFKTARIATFDEARGVREFFTSGTTRDVRGRHAFETMALYESAAIAAARRWLLPRSRYRFVLVAEDERENPHSSLSAMLAMFVRAWGTEGDAFFVKGGALDVDGVRAAIEAAVRERVPVALLGATFAFVHFWDAVGPWSCALAEGSVVMPTGGFKGRSRELSPDALMQQIRSSFGVAREAVVQEYGMTELSSQAYEAHCEGVRAGRYVCPPWMRVDAVDPETLEVLPLGEEGILRVIDLANLGSCVAIQTADLGVVYSDGFEVRGRMPGATPRGCARAMDALLGHEDP
jgi:hypothetical protein